MAADAWLKDIIFTGHTMFSGTATKIKTITGPFQGSMFDPITMDDPRWVWSWHDINQAASHYQTGVDQPEVWIW